MFIRRRKKENFILIVQRSGDRVPVTASSVDISTLLGSNATVSAITAATDTVQVTAGANNYTFTVLRGWAGFFQNGDILTIGKSFTAEPIATMTRAPSPNAATTSDTISYAVSLEFEVDSVNTGANQVVIKPSTPGNTLTNDYTNPEPGVRMILYNPVPAPSSVLSGSYKYAEMISKKVLDYLVANPSPFNAMPDTAHGNTLTEIIDDEPVQNSSIPGSLVPSCSSRKKEIIALYSGGRRFHGNTYHPSGHCFMRYHSHDGGYDEFCAVCKYILVDMIDPSKHGALDEQYSSRNIYPD